MERSINVRSKNMGWFKGLVPQISGVSATVAFEDGCAKPSGGSLAPFSLARAKYGKFNFSASGYVPYC